ncbi:MAG: hypothetical protein IKX63_06990 [Muribaculaceae bacterium]|nr:hypothetical protein [Muribaculaceae bacterium]
MISSKYRIKFLAAVAVALAQFMPLVATAQDAQDKSNEKLNNFTIDAELLTRGEIRDGGLPDNEEDNDNKAYFIVERARLGLDYERTFLKAHITAQHAAVWGQAGGGSFSLYEAWAQLTARNGLFAKIGRQVLSYDDERIIGSDDWTEVALSHDLLKVGYENDVHKIHAMFAYNQNGESVNGGTVYRDGDKPYKTMQTVWYHYDHPRVPFGASLLFMNLGLQSSDTLRLDKTFQQQLVGTYMSYRPANWSLEGSFYYQMGTSDYGIGISAWMASVKGTFTPSKQWALNGGYDHLSGDPHIVVSPKDYFGLIHHTKIKGFSPVYGTHHKFYGAMDFFYVTTFVDGFSPGLQNYFIGATYFPVKPLQIDATYHYLATSTKLEDMSKSLGHELEFSMTYKPVKEVEIALGYTYMHGDDTMVRLKRVESSRNLHWLWLNVVIRPKFLQIKW